MKSGIQENTQVIESLEAAQSLSVKDRVRVGGKFFQANGKKLYVKGVTYGPFKPEADGCEYHDAMRVERDFAKMAESGINTVRVYTIPPRWLLDLAGTFGLRVLIGIPWEQHITFLDDIKRIRNIEQKVRDAVRACSGHPAVFAYAVGNEIPSPMVRWYGAKKIEKFLRRLYEAGKQEDPEALFTYVNYPTTEYLRLQFFDFVCFNVYLETQEKLEEYLFRIQNIAGDKPLLMAELGLDSRRKGEARQAETMDWQIRSAFRSGCAGLFVFAWTDEWFRGGFEIEDWDFGLIRRDGSAKPSLVSVEAAFRDVPFAADEIVWPRISVVICTYNGSRTIRDCLEGLAEIEYPDFEVIIVNDGSTDKTEEIVIEFAEKYNYRIVSTPNRGLSNARNTGMEVATGEIVAYTDDDARPDPHWLQYLAYDYSRTNYAAIGGPNIPPAGDGLIAECVANAPGGPAHVLFSDRTAEHVPGCNMTFRRKALKAIGGFDPIYRTAGDDVDACWRIMERGWTIGFSPSAMVWHHRRNSVKTYWKQQYGYGKAEALLEEKWPEKFNGPGHLSWGGRVYNKGLTIPILFNRARIYQGVWGSAPFQSLYQPAPNIFASLVLMPEWYLFVITFAALSVMSLLWQPLWLAIPVFIFALTALVSQAFVSGSKAQFTEAVPPLDRKLHFRLKCLTSIMHLMQPLGRLYGRLDYGLHFWRRRGPSGTALPVKGSHAVWSEQWYDPTHWLKRFEDILLNAGFVVRHGGDYDEWDFEIRSGMFANARIVLTIEEHGAGKQYVRVRWFPQFSKGWLIVACLFAALSAAAFADGVWIAGALFGGAVLLIVGRALRQCSCAIAGLRHAVKRL